MLKVQEYLASGKTIDDLNKEFGINATYHPELPLVLLNYDQIESKPKTHPIVRECRALVLCTEDYSLVAKTFNRFFNHGEVADEPFDFNNCIVTNKEDGSLLLIYWFRDRWMAHTRGSFNMDNSLYGTAYTWKQLIYEALGVTSLVDLSLRKDITYVCELCSLHNKIVRKYSVPTLYLLAAFCGETELHWEEVDKLPAYKMVRVGRYHFKSLEEIMAHIRKYEILDPTYEGIVGQDINGRRKIKSETYYALHQLAGNGNLYHPRYLMRAILTGEQAELLTYYPEVEETLREYEYIVNKAYSELLVVWKEYYMIEDQKEFALAVMKSITPFTNLLFRLKKEHGVNQEEKHLRLAWRENKDQILKVLFKNITPRKQGE